MRTKTPAERAMSRVLGGPFASFDVVMDEIEELHQRRDAARAVHNARWTRIMRYCNARAVLCLVLGLASALVPPLRSAFHVLLGVTVAFNFWRAAEGFLEIRRWAKERAWYGVQIDERLKVTRALLVAQQREVWGGQRPHC